MGNPLNLRSLNRRKTGEDESREIELSTGDDRGAVKERKKYYYDGGKVEIVADTLYELDADGNRLRIVKLTDYTAQRVRSLYPNAASLRTRWANPQDRKEIIDFLEDKGITFRDLAATVNQPDADPFDLLCYIVFSTPLRTRREREQRPPPTARGISRLSRRGTGHPGHATGNVRRGWHRPVHHPRCLRPVASLKLWQRP
jgi:hypothetical protein